MRTGMVLLASVWTLSACSRALPTAGAGYTHDEDVDKNFCAYPVLSDIAPAADLDGTSRDERMSNCRVAGCVAELMANAINSTKQAPLAGCWSTFSRDDIVEIKVLCPLAPDEVVAYKGCRSVYVATLTSVTAQEQWKYVYELKTTHEVIRHSCPGKKTLVVKPESGDVRVQMLDKAIDELLDNLCVPTRPAPDQASREGNATTG